MEVNSKRKGVEHIDGVPNSDKVTDTFVQPCWLFQKGASIGTACLALGGPLWEGGKHELQTIF